MAAADTAHAGTLDWKLTVDCASPVRTLEPQLFGFNHEWVGTQFLLGDAANAASVLAAAHGLPLPLNRIGGTASQDVLWKELIGPAENRKPAQWWDHKPPNAHSLRITTGPLELVDFCERVDPKARFAITLNQWREEPADHADLAEFLVGIPGENRNGGIDWAERRSNYGRPKPVPVTIWELGNEMDWDSVYAERFPDVDAYIASCKKSIAAIRQVQQDARFAAGAATAPWSRKSRAWKAGDWSLWHQRILAELGQDIDWITFHPYYYGMPPSSLTPYFDTLRDDTQRITGGRVRVFLSEHAVWPEQPKDGRPWKVNWPHTHDLSGVLGTAQFLCFMMRRPEIGAATYHCLNGGPWSTISTHHSTGIAELWRFMAPLQTGTLLATAAHGIGTDPTTPQATADAVAVLGADGRLRLLLVNREQQAGRHLHLGGLSGWKPVAGAVLTAPSWHAVNTAEATPITSQAIDVNGVTSEDGWLVPARSVVRIELQIDRR